MTTEINVFIESLDEGFIVHRDNKTIAVTDNAQVNQMVKDKLQIALDKLCSINTHNLSITISYEVNAPKCQ